MAKQSGPMPLVGFDGDIYSLRSRKTVVPDFTTMSRIAVFQWLVSNTYARGHRRDNPLAGLGKAITVKSWGMV